VGLYRLPSKARDALAIVKPDIKYPLASRRFQIVLALEVEQRWLPADCAAGDTSADPGDEHC
jgi:hypothetical protein